jgi:hypothetical protein
VCWKWCPSGKSECGGALCVDSPDKCTEFAKSITTNAITAIIAFLPAAQKGQIDVGKAIEGAGGLAQDLANSVC